MIPNALSIVQVRIKVPHEEGQMEMIVFLRRHPVPSQPASQPARLVGEDRKNFLSHIMSPLIPTLPTLPTLPTPLPTPQRHDVFT